MVADTKSKAAELRTIASRLLRLADDLDSDNHALGADETNALIDTAKSGANGNIRPDDVTSSYAEAIFHDRQRRAKFFPDVPFADPAWDILLDLYFRSIRGEKVTVSNACVAAGVPTTTALRWIDILIDLSLIKRKADASDRRRILLVLTADCRQKLSVYFSELAVVKNLDLQATD